MATSGTYSVTIRAIDQTSTIVAKINKKLFDQTKIFRDINGSMSSLGKEFTRMGKITGFTPLIASARTLGGHIASAAKSTFSFIEALIGISGLASVAGIIAMTQNFAKYNVGLSNTSLRLNESAAALERWQHMGELANISAETMSQTIQGLEMTMRNANNGGDRDAANLFRRKGIDISSGKATEVLPQIADLVKTMKDAGTSAATINAMLDQMHIPLDLLPMLVRGSKGLKDLADRTKDNNSYTERGAGIAQKFFEAQTLTFQAAEKLSKTIGQALSPAFTKLLDAMRPLIQRMTDWVSVNEKWINDTTVSLVQQFVTWLGTLTKSDFNEFLTGLRNVAKIVLEIIKGLIAIATGVKNFIEDTVGWKLATEIIGAALIANVLKPLIAIGWNLGKLAAFVMPAWLATLLGVTLPLAGDTPTAESEERQAAYDAGPAAWEAYKTAHPSMTNSMYEYGAPPPGFAPRGIIRGIQHMFGAGEDPVKNMGFNDAQWGAFRSSILGIEHAKSGQMGGAGNRYAGMFQMGPDEIAETATSLGVEQPSQADFLADPAMQDRFFEQYTKDHYEQLMADPKFRALSLEKKAEILAYAHSAGADGAKRYLNGGASAVDGFGTKGSSYGDAVRKNWNAIPDPSAPIKKEELPPLQQQGFLGSGNINVSFAGFPPGLFKTSASSDGGLTMNTTRTSGPIFA